MKHLSDHSLDISRFHLTCRKKERSQSCDNYILNSAKQLYEDAESDPVFRKPITNCRPSLPCCFFLLSDKNKPHASLQAIEKISLECSELLPLSAIVPTDCQGQEKHRLLTDEGTELVRQLPCVCCQHLPSHIFKDNWPRLKVHHEHGLQLRLRSLKFDL